MLVNIYHDMKIKHGWKNKYGYININIDKNKY